MTIDSTQFLTDWHRAVAEKDHGSFGPLLAADVTLGAPPYWEKLEGHALVHHLLGLIVDTIEGFTYHREWVSEGELALEFTGRIGELQLQGIDLISLNEQCVIQNLDVLIRPANAVGALIQTVAPQMAAFIARSAEGAG